MPKVLHVAIIGGGMAGLAASSRLAENRIESTLFEAGSYLGGRARSVAVEFSGQVTQLDNGQHILLGAYHETLALLEKVGVPADEAFIRLPLALETLAANGKLAFKLSSSNFLPYPFNLLLGFLRSKGLSLREQLSVIRCMIRLKRIDYMLSTDESLNIFLLKQKQSARVINYLWEPLCLSALNTPLHLASTKVFLNVLRDAFSRDVSNSDILLPKSDLSKIFSQPISRYIQSKKSQILLNHRVKTIKANNDSYSIVTKSGILEFSHVIIATSAIRFGGLVTDLPKLKSVAIITDTYDYQPIYTIYLQYPSNISLSKPMLGLSGTYSQWVFDRGIICGQHGLMAVVISAEGKHQKLEHEALALEIAQELKRAFPQLKKPLWHQVIAEKRATFSCKAHLARPANSTLYRNLYIAGDYTYADYPATIEGAIRSGINAANLIVNP